MADDLENVDEYWASFRKPYTPPEPNGEAEEPIGDSRFSQEELEQGLLAIRALRAERRLAPGNPTPRPIVRPSVSPAEVEDLNRALRSGLGLPQEGVIVSDDSLLRNLEAALRMLGFRSNARVDDQGRTQVELEVGRGSGDHWDAISTRGDRISLHLTLVSPDPTHTNPTEQRADTVTMEQLIEALREIPPLLPITGEVPFNRYDNRLTNLVEAFRVLGFRTEVWANGEEWVHVYFPEVRPENRTTLNNPDSPGFQFAIRP
jgi:hypothetical protein